MTQKAEGQFSALLMRDIYQTPKTHGSIVYTGSCWTYTINITSRWRLELKDLGFLQGECKVVLYRLYLIGSVPSTLLAAYSSCRTTYEMMLGGSNKEVHHAAQLPKAT